MAASSASSRSTSQASSRSSSASSSDRRRARPRRKNPVTPSHGPAGPLQSPPFISRYVVNQWGDSHVPQQGIAGLPALQVFYRSLPKDCPDITNVIVNPSIEELKKAHDNAHATEKPMRMRIGSLAIIQELEVISGLALPPVCE
ncbi:hypothetical protein F4780DRAFT_522730 [Xylariomycetidae sp. FL0641]|nr:hypothetical protein F4780DRAFT_522730 [Xylariomycetidae sp. FL0641]